MIAPPRNVVIPATPRTLTIAEVIRELEGMPVKLSPDGTVHPDDVARLNARFAPYGYRIDESCVMATVGAVLYLIDTTKE